MWTARLRSAVWPRARYKIIAPSIQLRAASQKSTTSDRFIVAELAITAAIGVAGATLYYEYSLRGPQVNYIPSSALHPPTLPVALDLESANHVLKALAVEDSFPVGDDQIGKVHRISLASNFPTEDQDSVDPAESKLKGMNRWRLMSFFGVYDGHAGWATSQYLRERLTPWVLTELEKLPEESAGHTVTSTIREAFLSLDEQIANTALAAVMSTSRSADPMAIAALAPAIAGSCALLACYDPKNRMLRVACVGDSRAVMGRYSAETKGYQAVALSEDQSGKNEAEVARLTALHPDEPDMVKGLRDKGRLFGLAVTRAFGDHRWKMQNEDLKRIQEEQFGTAPRPGTKTAPYLTAEPVITETPVRTKREHSDHGLGAVPDFVILASDGLWDHISNEDAVACVESWLSYSQPSTLIPRSPTATNSSTPSTDDPEERPFWLDDGFAEWKYKPDWLVNESSRKNAAEHLVRNVLGGRNNNFFCGLMTAYHPMSRHVRDDITVQVIFFEDVSRLEEPK